MEIPVQNAFLNFSFRFAHELSGFQCFMFEQFKNVLHEKIWRTDPNQLGMATRPAIHALRTLIVAVRSFQRHQCQLKASALTFYTLLSIVPVIAMLFGIAKGFGLERKLESEFRSDLSYNQEVISYVFDLATSMLENTQGGLIAGFGVVLLFWSVMKVLGNIEKAFNDIWEVEHARSWTRKFTDYMSIMLLAPVVIIVSSSIAVFISTEVESATDRIGILSELGPLIYFGLRFVPVLLNIALFTLVYRILPNTKVNIVGASFGALFTALLFEVLGQIYLTFQIGVSNYNAIYGGFAALPLFLVWVQTTWLVVLLGAEIGAAFQPSIPLDLELTDDEPSFSFRFLVAVAIVRSVIERFTQGREAPNSAEIAEEIGISAKRVQFSLNQLIQCRILAETLTGSGEPAYLPAIDIAKIDLSFIWLKLSGYGMEPATLPAQLQSIKEGVEKYKQDLELLRSKYNRLLKYL